MKLFGCTVVRNEEKMCPYVIPYLEFMGYDKLFVYNDSCTDNTIEILEKLPFVEILDFKKQETIRDFDNLKCQKQVDFYQYCWEQCSNDIVWAHFFDFDEVLYVKTGCKTFKEELYEYGKGNYFDDLMLEVTKVNNFHGGFVHTYDDIRFTYSNSLFHKCTLLKVNDFKFVNTYPGNHFLDVEIENDVELKRLSLTSLILPLHLKNLLPMIYQYNKYDIEDYKNTDDVCKRIEDDIKACSFTLGDYMLNNKPKKCFGLFLKK